MDELEIIENVRNEHDDDGETSIGETFEMNENEFAMENISEYAEKDEVLNNSIIDHLIKEREQKATEVVSNENESDIENFETSEVLSDKVYVSEETAVVERSLGKSDCEKCEAEECCDRCVMKEVLQELGLEYPF